MKIKHPFSWTSCSHSPYKVAEERREQRWREPRDLSGYADSSRWSPHSPPNKGPAQGSPEYPELQQPEPHPSSSQGCPGGGPSLWLLIASSCWPQFSQQARLHRPRGPTAQLLALPRPRKQGPQQLQALQRTGQAMAHRPLGEPTVGRARPGVRTCGEGSQHWQAVPQERILELREVPHLNRFHFVSSVSQSQLGGWASLH